MRSIICLVTAVCALTAVATTASASSGSSCQTNRTFQQAAKNGALPAIYAALHGGAPVSANCFQSRN
jgi:hypothetical protein